MLLLQDIQAGMMMFHFNFLVGEKEGVEGFRKSQYDAELLFAMQPLPDAPLHGA